MTGVWWCWPAPFAGSRALSPSACFIAPGPRRAARALIWVALDAAVGGCGIWATHFVAMLAYDPGAGAGYSIPVTLLSLVFAIGIAPSAFASRWQTRGNG